MEKRYLLRIVSLLLAFLLLLMLPFSLLMHHQSKKNTAESIQDSNELFLQRMKQDYLLFKENTASTCLSVFCRADVQMLLYARDMDAMNAYQTVWDVMTDVVMTNPSLHSIQIYNSGARQLFSTTSASSFENSHDQDLYTFLQGNPEIKKLTPVLRQITLEDGTDASTYVFSYFMYEHTSPSSMESSFLVVNQNASWFVESLTQVRQSAYESMAYLLSTDSGIVNYDHTDIDEDTTLLLSECMERTNLERGAATYGSYVSTLLEDRYLISWLELEAQGDLVVLVQNYDQAFGQLKSLTNSFLIILAVLTLVGGVAIIISSRWLYQPLDQLVSYATELDEDDVLKSGDEFSRLQSLLDHTSSKNRQLMEQKSVREDVLQRLMLNNLLQDSGEDSWHRYKSILQNAPLSRQRHWNLAVILIELTVSEENEFGFLPSEESLLHYAVFNIFRDVLDGSMVDWVRKSEKETAFVVNLSADEERSMEDILELLRVLVRENLDITLTIAYSRAGNSIHLLPELYQEAQRCLQYRAVYDQNTILSMALCRGNEDNPKHTYGEKSEKKLMDAIRTQRVGQAMDALDEIQAEITGLRYPNITASLMELLLKIKLCITESGSNLSNVNEGFLDLHRKIVSEASVSSIFSAIRERVQAIIDTQQPSVEALQNQQFTAQIIRFIEENYSDSSLGLQAISAHMGLSERYVSRKFRQSTDISITEYILGYRMQKAAEMLIQPDCSIDDIIARVGIPNKSYFYHLFKKQFGCTPKDFASSNGLRKKKEEASEE